ncbi:MAG: MarR family transcriptional regulator [Candidatus Faecousia sp.]|nr:MarR family transcriptional regulator [Candidatus Faecousia sp.]
MNVHYGHLIRILHWCTDRAMTEALEKMDLTAAQGRLMAFLSHRGEQPTYPKDLEAALHLSHPTVSGLLSRLEQKGFVILETDPADRRSRRIVISPKGMQCHERMLGVICDHENRIVRGFTPEERVQFAAFLQRAIDNLCPEGCHEKEDNHP